MGKGLASGLVGILFRHTKAQSMQLIWAPESMITVVSTAFIVSGEMMNFNGIYKEFFRRGVLLHLAQVGMNIDSVAQLGVLENTLDESGCNRWMSS